jgi:hypothetical protein
MTRVARPAATLCFSAYRLPLTAYAFLLPLTLFI